MSALVPDRSVNPRSLRFAARARQRYAPDIATLKPLIVQRDQDPGFVPCGGQGMAIKGMRRSCHLCEAASRCAAGTSFTVASVDDQLDKGAIEISRAELDEWENADFTRPGEGDPRQRGRLGSESN